MKLNSIVVVVGLFVTAASLAQGSIYAPVEPFHPQAAYDIDVQKTSAAEQQAYKAILNQINIVVGKHAAIPIMDENYKIFSHSTNENPNVPVSVYQMVEKTRACDLNTVGACIVLEVDRETKVNTAYYLAGAVRNRETCTGYGVIRYDVDAKLNAEITTLVGNKPTGMYLISQAADQKAARELDRLAKCPGQQPEILPPTPAPPVLPKPTVPPVLTSPYPVATTAAEIQYFENETQKIQRVVGNQSAVGSKLPFNVCYLKAVMVPTRRFFILDFLTEYVDANGVKKFRPTKASIANPTNKTGPQNNQLFCHLKDGTLQFPRVAVNEYQMIRIGFGLSKAQQTLFATGIGWANGVLDILKIGQFGYIAKADVDFLVGGVSFTPLILSRTYLDNGKPVGAGPVLSAAVSGGIGWRFINANATLGGWYEVTLDPNDG